MNKDLPMWVTNASIFTPNCLSLKKWECDILYEYIVWNEMFMGIQEMFLQTLWNLQEIKQFIIIIRDIKSKSKRVKCFIIKYKGT